MVRGIYIYMLYMHIHEPERYHMLTPLTPMYVEESYMEPLGDRRHCVCFATNITIAHHVLERGKL